MPTPLEQLRGLLRELFQFDLSDLDFGIYRLFRLKQDELKLFIETQLPATVDKSLADVAGSDTKQLADEVKRLRNRSTKAVHLRFLESHGMHHDGLFGANQPKIECLKELGVLSARADFKKQKFSLDGLILTWTKKDEIPGAEKKTRAELRRDYCLVNEDGLDAGTLFQPPT